MSISRKITSLAKKHLSNLKELHDRRVERAEIEARRRLAKAKTETAQEKVRLQLVRERLLAKKELYEAQAATREARRALEKARKEAGDLTLGERLSKEFSAFGKDMRRTMSSLQAEPKPKRKTTRKKQATGLRSKR